MLFIANLLLIRDASMHNKRSPKKKKKKKPKKKAQDHVVFK